MSEETNRLPTCLGLYSPKDAECNGDPEAVQNVSRLRCAWGAYCEAFGTYVKSNGGNREDYVEVVTKGDGSQYSRAVQSDNPTFIGFLRGLVAHEQQGMPSEPSGEEPQAEVSSQEGAQSSGKPIKRSRRKARRWRHKSQSVAFRKQESLSLMVHFLQRLGEQFPGRLPKPGFAPVPGQFFWVDRRKASGYVAVYCAPKGGRRIPVALMRPELLTKTLVLELPFEAEVFNAEVAKRDRKRYSVVCLQHPTCFKTKVTGMELGALAWMAEQIKKLESRGLFTLPEVNP